MKKSDITYVTGSVYAAIVSIFYCCIMKFHITVPRYYPTEHTWKMINEPGKATQGWYGVQTYAFIAAGIVVFIMYLILKRKTNDDPLKPATAKRIAVAVSTIVVACLTFIVYHQFKHWGIL